MQEYVEIEKLALILVHDEVLTDKRLAVRMVGYVGCRIPHGILWGGRGNACYYKDLLLAPRDRGSGLRLDRRRHDLVDMALRLCGGGLLCARQEAGQRRSLMWRPALPFE